MSLNVISLFPLPDRSRDWTKQELAEFYRVAASLVRGGVSVETDRGRSDEGDPWFVFSQIDTGDVIIHFARFDGDYIVASPALGKCVRGRDFRALIESLIESHPLVVSTAVGGSRLFVHPAALLVVLVTTCFFKLYPSSAAAAEQADHVPVPSANASATTDSSGDTTVVLDERAAATVLTVIAVAVAWVQSDNSDLGFLGAAPMLDTGFSAHAEFAAQGAPAEVSDAFKTAGLYDGGHEAVAGSAVQTVSPASGNPLQSPGGGNGGLSPTDHNLTIHDFPTGGSSSASSDEGASLLAQSVAPPSSDHVLWLPILTAAASTSTPAAAADATIASAEVGVAIGVLSFRAHVITDVSGSEQKFVLEVAGQTASTIDSTARGTAGDSKGAAASQVSSATDANPTTGSSDAAASPPSHQATAATGSSAGAPTTDASSPASNGSVPTVTTSPPSVDGTSGANSLPNAEAAIQQFVVVHPDFQIINSQNEIIIYDPHLTPANLPTALEEAFTFHDGSSVVLIGLPPGAEAHGLA